MSYYYDKNWVPNFNVRPVFPIKDTCSWKGNDAIVCALKDRIAKEGKEKLVVTFDYMYGFDESVLLEKVIKQLGAATLIDTNEAKYPEPVIQEKFGKYITEDRIMGVYIPDQVDAFFDPAAVEKQRRAIRDAKGLVVVYGVAAEVVCGGDVLVYCNVTEKTIGDRMRRKGLGNWGADNGGDEFLKRQKRNNFVEKRVLYWHRTVILPVIDYMMDCNDEEALVMVDRETFDKGVNSMARRPYQSCPRWTESIWGGDRAQKVLGADPTWAGPPPAAPKACPSSSTLAATTLCWRAWTLSSTCPKRSSAPASCPGTATAPPSAATIWTPGTAKTSRCRYIPPRCTPSGCLTPTPATTSPTT